MASQQQPAPDDLTILMANTYSLKTFGDMSPERIRKLPSDELDKFAPVAFESLTPEQIQAFDLSAVFLHLPQELAFYKRKQELGIK